jgi:hypothetical protein
LSEIGREMSTSSPPCLKTVRNARKSWYAMVVPSLSSEKSS